MIHLRGLFLVTLFPLGFLFRRNFRSDKSHHNAQQQNKALAKTQKLTAVELEALVPGTFWKGLLPRLEPQAGNFKASHGRWLRQQQPDAATSANSRREVLSAGLGLVAGPLLGPAPAGAFVAGQDQETSGLVVLRVAEVCGFQEKVLRILADCGNGVKGKGLKDDATDQFGNKYCDSQTYSVNPAQISFGTGLLLKNSNLDGNLKLMIQTDVPRAKREAAVKDAVRIMNTFTDLANKSQDYTEFTATDLVMFADIYKDARQQLAKFFDYLPQETQDRFYGYANEVRKYEEKVSSEEGIERMRT